MAEFLSQSLPAMILMLGVLVFVHEFGHFIVGKLFKVGVEVFSIGMGPRIFGWRRNGTDYRISILPIGGYVRFSGDEDLVTSPENKGKEFSSAPKRHRALIMAAGPAANLLLAIFGYAVLGMVGVKHPSPIVGEVRSDSAAEAAGIRSGDRVMSIAGKPVEKWSEMTEVIASSPDIDLSLEVQRLDGSRQQLTLRPKAVEATNRLGKKGTIGRAGIGHGTISAQVTVLSKQDWGIESGDFIKAIYGNGETIPIGNWFELEAALAKLNEAKSLEVRVERDGQVISLQAPPRPQGGWSPDVLGVTHGLLTIGEDWGPLKKYDLLLRVNGEELKDIYHLSEILEDLESPQITVLVDRRGRALELPVKLQPLDEQRPEGKVVVYRPEFSFLASLVSPKPFIEKYENPLTALWYGVRSTAELSSMVVSTLAGLITGDVPLKALGGPMLIAKVAGDAAQLGWQAFLLSMVMISINLALINLFPIPALDGGQLVMLGAEAVKGSPLSQTAMENFRKIGFVMIMALMILATYNDFSRFWTGILRGITGGTP